MEHFSLANYGVISSLKLSIAYPHHILGILLSQKPDLLPAEEVVGEAPSLFNFSDKLF